MTASLSTSPPTTIPRTPLYVNIAAWSVPVLVLGQFSMVAILPVALLVIAALVDKRVRPLRIRTALVAAVYLMPLAIWILREDGAESLSKDMNPLFIGLIALASAALLHGVHRRRTR